VLSGAMALVRRTGSPASLLAGAGNGVPGQLAGWGRKRGPRPACWLGQETGSPGQLAGWGRSRRTRCLLAAAARPIENVCPEDVFTCHETRSSTSASRSSTSVCAGRDRRRGILLDRAIAHNKTGGFLVRFEHIYRISVQARLRVSLSNSPSSAIERARTPRRISFWSIAANPSCNPARASGLWL